MPKAAIPNALRRRCESLAHRLTNAVDAAVRAATTVEPVEGTDLAEIIALKESVRRLMTSFEDTTFALDEALALLDDTAEERDTLRAESDGLLVRSEELLRKLTTVENLSSRSSTPSSPGNGKIKKTKMNVKISLRNFDENQPE
ncbi:Hypothetical predicted protein, partial [Paramuricea clavata]